MDENATSLVQTIAQNYCLFLADFPSKLKPEHLDVPSGEQATLFSGLSSLYAVIGDIYNRFTGLTSSDRHWSDREYCYRAIEAPVRLLWALGVAGRLSRGPEGLALEVSREGLDKAVGRCGVKNPAAALSVLEEVGFDLVYRYADSLPCPEGFKKCAVVVVRYPAHNIPMLRALNYYVRHLPEKKTGRKEKGVIFEVLLRADFRPLLPGYSFHMPHLPAEEREATRTFKPDTLKVWKKLTGFMTGHYPQCQLYFRVPRIRGGGWVADYSVREGDYGLFSIFIEEGGLYVRIVLIEGTINQMLEHVEELPPDFQENYLNAVACKDCIHCGRHVFYTHGNHVHRLCKSPWYISPHLTIEDLPNIERLIDFRLTNL